MLINKNRVCLAVAKSKNKSKGRLGNVVWKICLTPSRRVFISWIKETKEVSSASTRSEIANVLNPRTAIDPRSPRSSQESATTVPKSGT